MMERGSMGGQVVEFLALAVALGALALAHRMLRR